MSATDTARGALLVMLGGCVGTAGPSTMPTALQAASSPYGGRVEALVGGAPLAGELLAVSADTMWVLTPTGGQVVPRTSIQSGRVIGYNSETSQLLPWAILGPLSTIANGYLLAVTFPAWVITGSAATHTQRNKPIIPITSARWRELRLYARFPQGMPNGVTLQQLTPPTRQ